MKVSSTRLSLLFRFCALVRTIAKKNSNDKLKTQFSFERLNTLAAVTYYQIDELIQFASVDKFVWFCWRIRRCQTWNANTKNKRKRLRNYELCLLICLFRLEFLVNFTLQCLQMMFFFFAFLFFFVPRNKCFFICCLRLSLWWNCLSQNSQLIFLPEWARVRCFLRLLKALNFPWHSKHSNISSDIFFSEFSSPILRRDTQ